VNLIVFGLVLPWLLLVLAVVLGCWLSFQLIHQNGRILAHLEALQQRREGLRQAPAPESALPAALPAGAAPGLAPDPVYGRLLMRLEALEQRLAQPAPCQRQLPAAPPGSRSVLPPRRLSCRTWWAAATRWRSSAAAGSS